MTSEFERLISELRVCSKCPRLVLNRRQILGEDHHPILPSGNIESRILIVGTAPGRLPPQTTRQDVMDRPFAQGSGDMLDEALSHVSLTRNDVFIANILQCNTPEDKQFTPKEEENCRPFIDKILKIQQPKMIIALGAFARDRLGGNVSMKSGDHKRLNNDTILFYFYHPAYIQRNPSAKPTYLQQWLTIKSYMPEKKSQLKEWMK